MNTKYLSEEKLKVLKSYLNEKLPNKVRAGLLQIKLKFGFDLYYDSLDNQRVFWKYCNDELHKSNDILAAGFNIELSRGETIKAGNILKIYINQKYSYEWQLMQTFDATGIENWLNGICGFCKENHIDRIDLKELIECPKIDNYLDEKFSKKNVNPESLKRTKIIIEGINALYQNADEFYLLQEAVSNYIFYKKDESILHNMINE